ncbi:reverse transcriptase domain-containing protein [Tanacetum coccineum]
MMYPPTTSESSARDSSSESSAGPSRKRCRSPAATVTSFIHATRALVLSHADLLPPRKRFRDFISLEDSVKEDIDTDVLENIKADATVVKDDVKEEVESNDKGTMEVGVDVVARIDIPDGMLIPDVVEHLEQVKEGLQDIYEYVIEILFHRIEDIKTGQKELEARSLIADGERASLLNQCMRTRRSNYPNNSNVTIPRRRKRQVSNIVKPEIRTIVAPMAERTMEELLRAPTEGYGEAIVLPEINADHFEIKTNLLQLVQANPFYGRESENPHAHINSFKRITSTLQFRNVPNDVIKLMMFPYSLEGAAKTWYEKEPPNSILTWEDLVTKFVNQFFPPSKTTHLKNEISRFTQKFEETFSEVWERFKELLRACPHHGFTELTQVDTFYNGLNENEQDSLNAATGGNLLSKMTREALNIIENKSKVCYSRNRSNASRMNATSSKTDEVESISCRSLSTLVEIVSKKVVTPAPVKAVEESCVTCGGAHSWYNCPATDNNQASVCATTGTYNQVNPPNRVSNQMAPPASTSGTLSSNTIPNPKGEMKAITTRSGVAYEGPSIPTNPSPKKVVERETEETTDKEQTNFQGSTAQILPPVIPISISEPDVPTTLPKTTPILESDISKSLPKPNIPYPSRHDNQK